MKERESFEQKRGVNLELSKLLGETTEYDKKREVEMRKPKSWLKASVHLQTEMAVH